MEESSVSSKVKEPELGRKPLRPSRRWAFKLTEKVDVFCISTVQEGLSSLNERTPIVQLTICRRMPTYVQEVHQTMNVEEHKTTNLILDVVPTTTDICGGDSVWVLVTDSICTLSQ